MRMQEVTCRMFQQRRRIQKAVHIVMSLICLVDLSVSSQCNLGISKAKFVYEIGETLNITCTQNYLEHFTTIPDVFIKEPNGSQQTMNHVDGSTNFTFTMNITSCSQSGTYICMTDQCNETTLRNSFQIRVEDTKNTPKLECMYNRYFDAMPNLTCTWVANCMENWYKWMLFYKKQSDADYQKCNSTSSDSCVIQADGLQFQKIKLRLVQMADQHENKTFEYPLHINERIWRLGVKVYNVTYVSSDKLNITLQISDRIETLICRVNFTSEWEQRIHQVNFYLQSPPDLKVVIPLEHLEPFTLYNLSVDCRPSQSPYWSAPTENVLIKTQSVAPDKIPSSIKFSDEILTTGKRQIYLYWRPLSKRCLRGNRTQYSVKFVNGTNETFTEYFPSNTTTAILSHHFPPEDEIYLQIGSRNEKGTGTTNKTIIIPSHTPASFLTVVVNSQDNANIYLFWAGQTQQEGRYIYYWCHGTSVNGHPPRCQTELVSKSSNDTTITIKTNSPGNRKWYFGAGVQRNKNETSVGRIVFSKCTFTDAIQDEMPQIDLSAAHYNSTTITLTLPKYCNFHNMPSTYQVATFTKRLNCSNLQSYTNYSASPSLNTLTIEWTNDKAAYICFRVLYNTGFASKDQLLIIDSIDQVESSSSKEVVVGVLVAIGILLILASTILVRRYREKLKNRAKIEEIIIFPSNPPHTTDRESFMDPVIADENGYPVITAMRDSLGSIDVETENQSVSDQRSVYTYGDEFNEDRSQSEFLFSGINTEEQTVINSEDISTRNNTLIEDSASVAERPEGIAVRAGTHSVIYYSVYSDRASQPDITDTFETFPDDSLHSNRMILQSDTDSNVSLELPSSFGNNTDTRSLDISSSNSSNSSGSTITSYVQPIDISNDSRTFSIETADQSGDDFYVFATISGSTMTQSNQVARDGILQAVSMNYITAGAVPNSSAEFSSDSAISEFTSLGSVGSYVAGFECTI